VLHGGGNTSVKICSPDITGKQEVLFVKGSGIDLAGIEPAGFVGVELEPLRRLAILDSLSDEEMENQLQIHKISARSPNPSVEALLHGFSSAPLHRPHPREAVLILTAQPGERVW